MLTLDQRQLLEEFSSQSDRLFDLGVIRTDSFTGEIGEYVACEHFGLTRTSRVTKAVDAVDKAGKRYQVKAKVAQGESVSYNIVGVQREKIDYLVVVYFTLEYQPMRLLRIPSSLLPAGSIRISKKFLEAIDHLDFVSWEISVPERELAEIRVFGAAYIALVAGRIVRSRRIVGDIGEYFACFHLGLTLCEKPNEVRFDAVGQDGTTYEIKTRRVYGSGRRESKSRRLNNLVGKSADMLVVVALDRSFGCAGMWTMPMRNVHNPKSASLRVVNTTPGVKNIVRSQIDWLR